MEKCVRLWGLDMTQLSHLFMWLGRCVHRVCVSNFTSKFLWLRGTTSSNHKHTLQHCRLQPKSCLSSFHSIPVPLSLSLSICISAHPFQNHTGLSNWVEGGRNLLQFQNWVFGDERQQGIFCCHLVLTLQKMNLEYTLNISMLIPGPEISR